MIINSFRFGLARYNVPNNDISGAFSNTANIVWDTTRGYYLNLNDYDTLRGIYLPFATNKVRQVGATFTSYYNTPAGCIGASCLVNAMDDASTKNLGCLDGFASETDGQNVYRGDQADQLGLRANVVDLTFIYTIPTIRTLSTLNFRGGYYLSFPATTRGVKDIYVMYEP